MLQLTNISVVKDLLSRHGFHFSKALGQNFIINPSICPKMAEMAGANDTVGVIEIGTGIGVLTAELAKRAKKVVAIELDTRLLPILEETLSDFDHVKVINQDVLKVDLHQLIREEFEGMDVIVCANLPYYITSPIIMMLLESHLRIRSVTVMVQKEAAQRICAMPGTRAVGAVSVAVRYYSNPQILFQVSRGSFMPSPDVDSCVIRLDLLDRPAVNVENEEQFFKVVKAAFSQRRKTIVNCLASGLGVSKAQITELLTQHNLSPTARAEQLSMQDFEQICEAVSGLL